MLAIIKSASVTGVTATPVQVEVHVAQGLPGLSIVGVPDGQCREIRDRVRAAFLNSGLPWPQKRITVNVVGGRLTSAQDLPIAVGVLVAAEAGGMEPWMVDDAVLVGELGPDGRVRPVPGGVAMGEVVGGWAMTEPTMAAEMAVNAPDRVHGLERLIDVVQALQTGDVGDPAPPAPVVNPVPAAASARLEHLRGNARAKRAVTIAAAAGFGVVISGPSGSGKTLLAERVVGLLPDLTYDEQAEVAAVRNAAGAFGQLQTTPPSVALYPSDTLVASIGGGTGAMRPGAVSMAHLGVLIVDNLAEHTPVVMDALRQPIDEGIIRLSRGGTTVEMPARVLPVATLGDAPDGPEARIRWERRVRGIGTLFVVRTSMDPDPGDGPEGMTTGEAREFVARARGAARSLGARCHAELPASMADGLHRSFPRMDEVMRPAIAAGLVSARGADQATRLALAISAGTEGEVSLEDATNEALGLVTGRTGASSGRRGWRCSATASPTATSE